MLKKLIIAAVVNNLFLIIVACGNAEIKNVSFSKDIQPILEENCYTCHSGDETQGNIHLDSYDRLIKSRYLNHTNPIAVAGNPETSRLYIVVNSNNSGIRMPPESFGYDKLNDSDILTIKTWIKEGAKNN